MDDCDCTEFCARATHREDLSTIVWYPYTPEIFRNGEPETLCKRINDSSIKSRMYPLKD